MRIKRVLQVDDDPVMRLIGEITLKRIGKWEVLTTDTGISALELAAEWMPDVILLDVVMPIVDGPTTFKILRRSKQCLSIPVIFVTGATGREEVDRLMQLGVAGVISKPYDPLSLPALIQYICDEFEQVACQVA
jgi:two-component system, OmpR family, response regulator